MKFYKQFPAGSRFLSIVTLAFAFSHAAQDTIRVDCGGTAAYTDATGGVWAADSGSSGGTAYSTSDAIIGTTDQTLWQTESYGDTQTAPFYYSFNVLGNTTYTVKLLFAEIYTGWCSAGSRVFNVDINGTSVLSNFDIYAKAGCETADIETFPVTTAANGNIKVNFTNVGSGHPKVNAIEIFKGLPTAISTKNTNVKPSLFSVFNLNGGFSVQTKTEGAYSLELSNLQGKRVGLKNGFGSGSQSFTNLNPGLYFMTLRTDRQNVTRMVSVVR